MGWKLGVSVSLQWPNYDVANHEKGRIGEAPGRLWDFDGAPSRFTLDHTGRAIY